MKILYIAFARIPTEKAHGLTIAKSCESFAKAGAEVTLMVPKRRTSVAGDVFSAYGLERNFKVVEIAVPDLVGRYGGSKFAFWLQYFLFYGAVKTRLIFASRKTVIYTREPLYCMYSLWGYKVALESHLIPKRRALYFFLARRASSIIVISKALRDSFVASGFEEKNILVAPSGVDLSVFDIDISREDAREQLDLPADAKVAVYTGNFTTMGEDKGLSDIVAALKEAPNVIFVAAGGSEKDIARYRAEAQEAGVADRVILRGYAPQRMLAIYQKAADMLLMPFPDTPHYRNHMSPVKMFEYMASKRPIVASGLPTIREVLNDSNAVIAAPGDPTALAASIETLSDQKGAALAQQAYSDVKGHTWQERSKTILRFLQ